MSVRKNAIRVAVAACTAFAAATGLTACSSSNEQELRVFSVDSVCGDGGTILNAQGNKAICTAPK